MSLTNCLLLDCGKLYYFKIFWLKFTQSSTFVQPDDNSRITECRSNKSAQQETVLFVGGHAVARCSWQREISHSANLFQFAYWLCPWFRGTAERVTSYGCILWRRKYCGLEQEHNHPTPLKVAKLNCSGTVVNITCNRIWGTPAMKINCCCGIWWTIFCQEIVSIDLRLLLESLVWFNCWSYLFHFQTTLNFIYYLQSLMPSPQLLFSKDPFTTKSEW